MGGVRIVSGFSMRGLARALAACALALCCAQPVLAERIRDLGGFQGVRANQLTGYGIVVGLDGSGDDTLEYLTQAMKGMSGRMGLQLPPGVQPGLKNAAAVLVTAELPAFSKPGQRIDVTVSAIGKAKSLRGGALILTPLYGADGQIYAMAQGNLAVGGLGIAAKDGSQLTVNIPTVGRIADGASVERAVATGFENSDVLRFNLFTADFLTAERVRDAVNRRWPGTALAEDAVTVALRLPPGADSRSSMLASIEMIDVVPADPPARVIINSRTGTVVINSAVRLNSAASASRVPFPTGKPSARPTARSPPKRTRRISRCSRAGHRWPRLWMRSTCWASLRPTLWRFWKRSNKPAPSKPRW